MSESGYKVFTVEPKQVRLLKINGEHANQTVAELCLEKVHQVDVPLEGEVIKYLIPKYSSIMTAVVTKRELPTPMNSDNVYPEVVLEVRAINSQSAYGLTEVNPFRIDDVYEYEGMVALIFAGNLDYIIRSASMTDPGKYTVDAVQEQRIISRYWKLMLNGTSYTLYTDDTAPAGSRLHMQRFVVQLETDGNGYRQHTKKIVLFGYDETRMKIPVKRILNDLVQQVIRIEGSNTL